jgi:hypothetical protein
LIFNFVAVTDPVTRLLSAGPGAPGRLLMFPLKVCTAEKNNQVISRDANGIAFMEDNFQVYLLDSIPTAEYERAKTNSPASETLINM